MTLNTNPEAMIFTDEESKNDLSVSFAEAEVRSEPSIPKVRFDVSVTEVINYSLQQNKKPILQRLAIVNDEEEAIRDLTLRMSSNPSFCLPLVHHVDLIPPKSTLRLQEVKLFANVNYIVSLTEQQVGILHMELCTGERCVAAQDIEITCLAFDEWHGDTYYPELLASFVTPNHPEVERIKSVAQDFLLEWTGDSSLDGYDSEDPNRVLSMSAAIYSALCGEGIRYATSPASFQAVGQRVRLCDMIIRQRMGNCLDLSLLYASVLEASGLHPILLLTNDHAFVGVWLEEHTFPEAVQDDPSLVTKRFAEGVNEIAVVECTLFTAGKNVNFDDARERAQKHFLKNPPVDLIIDVKRARLSGILPLPLRILSEDGLWAIDPGVTSFDASVAPTMLGETIRVSSAAVEEELPKLAQWERKLLDLGLRNQLINFRLTQNTLPILSSSADELENALAEGREYSIWECPADFAFPEGKISFESMSFSGTQAEVLDVEFKNGRLRTPYSSADTTRFVKELYRKAKTSMEENGANSLYLAMGLLRWYESERSKKERYAPLILFPIEILRKNAGRGYSIRLRDDEPRFNITLLEKLKQDFQIDIAGVDPLPQDGHGTDTRRVLTQVRDAVMQKKGWDVLESSYIGIFSFSQFVMWNDIRNRSEDLKRNKIVRSLIEGHLAWDAEEMQIDEHVSEEDVYLPIPADSSQLFAIKAACRGESFVLHGPPGTGKSQTITTLIANSLAQGKTVLFVAEKMAALEVVQRRLQKIGLGDFCLELHSNKSKKRDVLDQLRRVSEISRHTSSEQFLQQATRLAEMRKELDVYATALHRTLPCGLSVFDVIDRYEAVADAISIPLLDEKTVAALTPERLDDWRDLVDRIVATGQLIGGPKGHPLSLVGRMQYHQNLRNEVMDLAEDYLEALLQYETAAKTLGARISWTVAELSSLSRLEYIAEKLKAWLTLPRKWAEKKAISPFLESLHLLAQERMEISTIENEAGRLWNPLELHQSLLASHLPQCAQAVEEMHTQAESLSRRLNLEMPVAFEEYEHFVRVAEEVSLWTSLPRVWAHTESPNLYFAEITEMARCYLTARDIRAQWSHVWGDAFWELDGEALARELDEVMGKWALSRALGKNKLFKKLSTYAKCALEKEMLGEYLLALCRYRAESARAAALLEKHREGLDGYYASGSFDWERIALDAERARASLLLVRNELNAVDVLVANAGNRGLSRPIEGFLQAWKRSCERTDRLATLLCMDMGGLFSDWYAGVSSLCRGIEHTDARSFSLCIVWRMLSELVGAKSRPTNSVLPAIGARLGDSLWEMLGRRIVAKPLYTELRLTSGEADYCYRNLTRYLYITEEADRLQWQFEEELAEFTLSSADDWETLLHTVEYAEKISASMDRLCGDERIRTAFAARPELAGEIQAILSAKERMEPLRVAFVTLLEIEDLSGATDWIGENLTLCRNVIANIDSLKEWLTWNNVVARARETGLSVLIDAYGKTLEHYDVLPAYQKSLYRSLAVAAIDSDPVLNDFSGALFNEKIAQFKEMDRRHAELTKQEIFCRLASQIPNFAKEAARSSEVGILQKAIRNNGRSVSIRRLFEQLPNLLPRLAPCMLMSPLSAAQYLDPKREPFDLVVFDEASQLTTCKAVGALARGENAVIVGDPNQMPPTAFFTANTVDEDHIEEEDLESILDDCLSLNMPQTHLLWHYRSRHESLIAFSNSQFYENKLFTFPSVNDRETRVSMVRVKGIFDRGKTRQNRMEAEAIVAEICRRCYDPILQNRSIGVVTFNVSQQNLIDDLLAEACSRDTHLEKWVYESREPLFIKNLENVQGDERDSILFSIGYGPDATGQVYMNFGPLNREGGWRRLNVAVSRARHEMIVFSSMDADRIDLSKTSSEGVIALKAFLQYAATQRLDETVYTANAVQTYTDGIIDSIRQRLLDRGYETAALVGRSEYRVDIAVIDPRDPDRYLLGILLDGASYRAAKTARDREIGQIGVLRGLGWNVLRVWAMDWWDNSDKEIDRILKELEQLKSMRPEEQLSEKEEVDRLFLEIPPLDEVEEETEEDTSVYTLCDYRAQIPRVQNLDTDAILTGSHDEDLRERIRSVLAVEAPISESLLTKRILQGYGITRAGLRLQGKLSAIYASLQLEKTVCDGQIFYWSDAALPDTFRLIRKNGDGVNRREIRDVAIEEAVNAICRVLIDQFTMMTGDLIAEAAGLLGFTRMGTVVEARMRSALTFAQKNGKIVQATNGAWIFPEPN